MRIVSVGLVGLATWLTVSAVLPKPVDAGLPTVVAARDLPLGSTVGADDLRVEHRPVAERPGGVLTEVSAAVGQVLSGPVLRGEVVTTARFRGAGQLEGLSPGFVAVSLPLSDPALLATLRPADTVTLLSTGTGQPLAASARVLATDLPGSGVLAAGSGTGGHLVVAVTSDQARGLAAAMGPAGAGGGLLVAVRG